MFPFTFSLLLKSSSSLVTAHFNISSCPYFPLLVIAGSGLAAETLRWTIVSALILVNSLPPLEPDYPSKRQTSRKCAHDPGSTSLFLKFMRLGQGPLYLVGLLEAVDALLPSVSSRTSYLVQDMTTTHQHLVGRIACLSGVDGRWASFC